MKRWSGVDKMESYVWILVAKKSITNIKLELTDVTIMTLSFRTDRAGQTVQTQIRLLLEEQFNQGLHCLLFNLHLFENIPFV